MYYRHQLDYQYPEKCDQHMITVPHLWDVTVDENYPYLRKDFVYKCIRSFYWVAMHTLLAVLLPISHGLRIHGRENLKKHKDLLKNGAITISNHVFMWDHLCVIRAIFPHLTYFPAWKTNLQGPNGPLIRMAGGIPIPEGNMKAMKKFKAAMEEVMESGK